MKILEAPKNFNVIFNVMGKQIFIGDQIRYNTPEVEFNQEYLNKVYMDKIGFVPYRTEEGIVKKRIDIYEDQIYVADITEKNNVIVKHENITKLKESFDEIFSIYDLFKNIDFIVIEKQALSLREKIIKVCKYNLTMNKDEEVFVKEIDYFLIKFSQEKGIFIEKDGLILDIDTLEKFFKDISLMNSFLWEKNMPEMIFDGFSKEFGFIDIYKEYKEILDTLPSNFYIKIRDDINSYKTLKYYYYLGQKEYYYLAEYLIKNNMNEKIYEVNPIFTGKKIPSPKEIFVLSKISSKIIKEGKENHIVEALIECEKNPKIGVNGIKIIYEVLREYKKINKWGTPFLMVGVSDFFYKVNKIINIFDVTPKVLIEKCIRASFYENLHPSNYLQIILDYVEMCKVLKISIDKKIPQDVIRRHDLLQSQIIYMKNIEIEKMFAKQTKLNEELIKFSPEHPNLTIICPKTPNDLIEEGLEMNHCVGSYIDRFAEGHSKIFFIRNKKDINKSLVTVELNKNNLLVQAKGYSNSTPNKEIYKFILEWVDNINKHSTV